MRTKEYDSVITTYGVVFVNEYYVWGTVSVVGGNDEIMRKFDRRKEWEKKKREQEGFKT